MGSFIKDVIKNGGMGKVSKRQKLTGAYRLYHFSRKVWRKTSKLYILNDILRTILISKYAPILQGYQLWGVGENPPMGMRVGGRVGG